ncbi:metallophosphoesterase [Planctomycetota bacterium]|nr:metallophosphoesterase [Planctomycetota bacterium]
MVSDLHLAPAGPLVEFHAHRALAGLLRHVADETTPTLLVLNGDVFDTLQLPGYESLDLVQAGRRVRELLESLQHTDRETDVVAAVGAVLTAGHQVLVVPGNHDPELSLVDAQDALREALAPAPSARLRFHVDDDPWCVEVGARHVVGGHGHAADPWNALPPSRVLSAQARGDSTVALPPGSRLVLDVLNPYRRAREPHGTRRFPFLDLVKPEPAVFWLLWHLDPGLVLRRSGGCLSALAGATLRSLRRALLGGATLSAGFDTVAGTNTAADDAAMLLLEALDPEERAAGQLLCDRLNAALDAKPSASPAAPGALALGDWIRRLPLRAFRRAIERDRFFDPQHVDSTCRKAMEHLPDVEGAVLVTGHTHGARLLALDGRRAYMNTGTWQDLWLPTAPPEDDDALEAWVLTLADGRFPRTRRLTVGRVTEHAVELLAWDEEADALRPFSPDAVS